MILIEPLAKALGLLVGIEWGVGVKFNPPFLSGKLKGVQFRIQVNAVTHEDGVIKKLPSDDAVSNFMLYIENKSGNNVVLLSSNTSKKLMQRDLTMREMSNGIIYKNEIDYGHDL